MAYKFSRNFFFFNFITEILSYNFKFFFFSNLIEVNGKILNVSYSQLKDIFPTNTLKDVKLEGKRKQQCFRSE